MHCPSDEGSPGPFHYRLFGLHVESEMRLPELRPVASSDEPDVRISLATVASPHSGALVPVDEVAKYYVDGGSHIRVVREPGVPDRNVRLFLLGSAMGMLLHQRGLLPLHANAVEIDGKAFAFMGPSGSGKSTLAACFHDQGSPILADDVCVIRFAETGLPVVSAGLPRLRLWRDVIESSGRNVSDYQRSYAGDEDYEKYDVPIASDAVAADRPLAGIYLLERGEEFDIAPLGGVAAAEAVFANTYRGGFVGRAGNIQGHWESCLKLVRNTPVFRCQRTMSAQKLADEVRTMTTHARAL